MKLFPAISLAVLSQIILSCASTPKITDTSSSTVDPLAAKDFKLETITAKFSGGMADYKFKDASYKARWARCVLKPGVPFVAYFHGSDKATEGDAFCSDWTAQVLLKNGFNVVAVNRPSFAGSTGNDDMAGPQSVAASLAGIKMAVGIDPVAGFWGFDTGVIAASFSAKSHPNLKWLLLGNGFYDLEITERSTKSDAIRAAIQKQKISEGDSALEKRSIAWDAAGIPKLVAIYHAKADDVAPANQAEAFNDQLRTAQSKVFIDEFEGGGHDIPWQAHYQIVDKALKNLKQ